MRDFGRRFVGAKTEMNSGVVFMRMNFEQSGQDLCFSVSEYVDVTWSFYSCLMPRPCLVPRRSAVQCFYSSCASFVEIQFSGSPEMIW